MNTLETLEFEVAKCRQRLARGKGEAKARRRLEAAEAKLEQYLRSQELEAKRKERGRDRAPSAAAILALIQSCLHPSSPRVMVVK